MTTRANTAFNSAPGKKIIGFDGLTDSNSDPKINFVAAKPGVALFLDSKYTGFEKHTVAVTKKLAIEVMEANGGLIEYVAAQADNAERGTLIAIEDETHLIGLWDAPHTISLWAEDLCDQIPFLAKCITDTTEAIKVLKNSHVPKGAVKAAWAVSGKQSASMVLFSKTRWGHAQMMIQSLEKNVPIIQDVMTPLEEDNDFDEYTPAQKTERAYKAAFAEFYAGKSLGTKDRAANKKRLDAVRELAFSNDARSVAKVSMRLLAPLNTALTFMGADSTLILSVRPILHALVAEFELLKEESAATPMLTPEVWDACDQIMNVRVNGGAVACRSGSYLFFTAPSEG